MSKHVIQQGGVDEPIVIVYFVADRLFDDLRESIGPHATIIAFTSRPPEPITHTLQELGPGPRILVGYSAGCQDVRAALWAGVEVDAVIVIDGTHASLPPEPRQLACWAACADRARRGEMLFVATCTQQTYVETQLAKGERYLSTVSVLEQVTGAELRARHGLIERHEGDLHLHGYASAICDHDAHVRQQRQVLPEMLRRYLRPWLERQASPADAPCGLTDEDRAQASAAVAGSLRSLADGLDHGPKGDA
jgi:hypothetical protein